LDPAAFLDSFWIPQLLLIVAALSSSTVSGVTGRGIGVLMPIVLSDRRT
jgi:hypothetical protein